MATYRDDDLAISLVLTPFNDVNLALASQISVTDIIYYDMHTMPSSLEELQKIKEKVNSYGMRLTAVEGNYP
jgi:D-mannonate dehydratase